MLFPAWTENLHDILLVLVAFSTGINAIATGALIDIHTLQQRQKGKSAASSFMNSAWSATEEEIKE